VSVDRASSEGGRQLDNVVDGDRGRPGQRRSLPGVSLIKLFDEKSQQASVCPLAGFSSLVDLKREPLKGTSLR
jgi:hypothetical protein